jgi:hypothetical protein
MAISRYNKSWILNSVNNGPYFETFGDYWFIYDRVQDGTISSHEVVTKPNVRLEHVAFEEFGDSEYWWVLALCNNIGFAAQVRGGTYLLVPNNLEDILKYFKQ